MRLPLLASLVLVAGTDAVGQPQPRSTPAGSTTQELRTIFGRVVDALQRRDTVMLARLYAPKYRFAIGGGDSVTTLTRSERLQSIAASPDSIRRLTLESCDFDVFGSMALGGCWIRQHSGEGSGDWTGIYTTVVFRRVTGRWLVAGSHASVNRPKRRPNA